MSFDAEEGCLLVLRNYRGGQREDEEEEDVEWKFDDFASILESVNR